MMLYFFVTGAKVMGKYNNAIVVRLKMHCWKVQQQSGIYGMPVPDACFGQVI